MKTGLRWYKREPAAHLGGVQGLTVVQHAIYSVILDLCYAHGGEINNDATWISGWIADLGPKRARRVIDDLVANGKLILGANGMLTQSPCAREAAANDRARAQAAEAGKKGGLPVNRQ